jgi:hypothetical protein
MEGGITLLQWLVQLGFCNVFGHQTCEYETGKNNILGSAKSDMNFEFATAMRIVFGIGKPGELPRSQAAGSQKNSTIAGTDTLSFLIVENQMGQPSSLVLGRVRRVKG